MFRRFVMIAALVALGAFPLFAQHEHHGAKPGEMECSHHEMTKDQKELQNKLSDMDARLQQLVERMNSAQGQARIDAMAAVITELASQRTAMRTMMMGAQAGMSCCGGGHCEMGEHKKGAATPAHTH